MDRTRSRPGFPPARDCGPRRACPRYVYWARGRLREYDAIKANIAHLIVSLVRKEAVTSGRASQLPNMPIRDIVHMVNGKDPQVAD